MVSRCINKADQFMFKKNLLLILFFSSIQFSCNAAAGGEIFVRANQVGFLPYDIKTAIIMSKGNLTNTSFNIVNANNERIVFKGKIDTSRGKWGNFPFNYQIDFSRITDAGVYHIEIENKKSFTFKISKNIYDGITDSLLLFLRVQRCGPTKPFLHEPCHLYDSPQVIGDNVEEGIDVTGGWHDAGDYVKFLNTTALTTYMLLFSYEFDKSKFEFDHNKNNEPDILEEARIGIDWILRACYKKNRFVTQVQNVRDHEEIWRLPENDSLRYDRPAYTGIGKNMVGLVSATLSLASRIWRERFSDKQNANKWLAASKEIYQVRNQVPDVDTVQSGMYQDSRFWGKLALGAIELYKSTKEIKYLTDSFVYGDSAKSDYWWSWGDINALAQFRIAEYNPRFKNYLQNNLIAFNENKNKMTFGEGTNYSWGTTNTFLGIALQAILWKKLTRSSEYDSLKFFQSDYILGKNPWGISFIYNIGKNFSKNFHSQIAHFHNGYLPGAVSAGPAPKSILNNYQIQRTNLSYSEFNSDDVLYFDDKADYITNEPTIVSNATAIFVFGQLAR